MSCRNVYKTKPGLIIDKTESGYWQVKNERKKVSIIYYGDYWFHEFSSRSTLNWNSDFAKSINAIKDRKILYSAHTTLPPFCSTIGILYNNRSAADLVKIISSHVKTQFKAQNVVSNSEMFGSQTFIKLSYDLPDRKLKINTKFLEYYYESSGDVLRVVFWTIESRTEGWLENESKGIMQTVNTNFTN